MSEPAVAVECGFATRAPRAPGNSAGSRGAHRPRQARRLTMLLLAMILAAQALLAGRLRNNWDADYSPGPPPSIATAYLASLGEPLLAAYGMVLYVQSFDSQAGESLRIQQLDHAAVGAWLDRALDLAPGSAYPLLLATYVYAEGARPPDARALLEIVARRFEQDPRGRWSWLVHAIHLARHSLQDRELALRYARLLRERTAGMDVPSWTSQIELLLLADDSRVDAARVLLGALIDSGQLKDPAERAFLLERLSAVEAGGLPDRRPFAERTSRR